MVLGADLKPYFIQTMSVTPKTACMEACICIIKQLSDSSFILCLIAYLTTLTFVILLPIMVWRYKVNIVKSSVS